MQNIIVRSETPEDIRAIDVVNLSAFAGEAEARLVSAIREMSCFLPELSLVAEFNSRIVGHLLLTKVRYEHSDSYRDILALAPMSVVPSQSHRGIGADLIEAGISKAKDKGYGAIVVVGQPDYYKRFGFKPGSRWEMRFSLTVPEHAVTAMELEQDALPKGGQVIYPPLFSEIF